MVLRGQGELISGLNTGITKVAIWAIGFINLLAWSPAPSK